jgi:hypothetical protein
MRNGGEARSVERRERSDAITLSALTIEAPRFLP